MNVVRATMRLQLHRRFTFADAAAQVEFLAALGISHLYLSPIARARPGSAHGYDVIDPSIVNRQLGGERGLRALAASARRCGMGLIVDIVPNHLAADARNRWWDDLLRWGERSRFATFFDVDWRPPERLLRGKLLLPILAQPVETAAADGELRIGVRADGQFRLHCPGHDLPLSATSHALLLHLTHDDALASVARSCSAAAQAHDREAFTAAGRQMAKALQRLQARRGLQDVLRAFQRDARRLCDLLDAQHYQLVPWREASRHINWRRFFDVNDLVGVRVENAAVFDAMHALPLRLYAEGVIDGLRIDHIDGLHNPRVYCERLRARLAVVRGQRPAELAATPAFIVVEKILGGDEILPSDWPVDGTTGYAFMAAVGAWQHDRRGRAALDLAWSSVAPKATDFDALVRRCREQVIDGALRADVQRAGRAVQHALAREAGARLSQAAVSRAVRRLLVGFPLYRSYLEPGRAASDTDQTAWAIAFADADERLKGADAQAAARVRAWIESWPQAARGAAGAARAAAIGRVQQILPAIAAKAVEDSAGYRYCRLLSRCEVGSDAGELARSDDDLHAFLAHRAEHFPASLSATATHDHKRGADVRARLAVLSEMAGEWAALAERWRALLAPSRHVHGGAPEAADEYALWQMLLGIWPADIGFDDIQAVKRLGQRLGDWQRKALREAGLRSSWTRPAERYEADCSGYIDALLGDVSLTDFRQTFLALMARIAPAGAINGWAQTIMQVAAPGVPDLYQGNSLDDTSMVDPDNRRSVDFSLRAGALGSDQNLRRLLTHWRDGMLKQHLTQAALQARAHAPELFARGDYAPLAAHGEHAAHVFAFARRLGTQTAIAIVTHHPLPLLAGATAPILPKSCWARTELSLADFAGRDYTDVLTGRRQHLHATPPLHDILRELPVALLLCGAG